MTNYQNGKIYKIICDETNLTYYGSTTQKYLCSRLAEHRYKKNNRTKTKEMTNPKIYLVENFPCETKEQLLQRERYYIENNECINKQIPTRTSKEYYIDNQEKIKKNVNEYRQNNKDKISLLKKKYIENNKEKLLKKQKEKIDCECGCFISYAHLSRHRKTEKHLKLLSLI